MSFGGLRQVIWRRAGWVWLFLATTSCWQTSHDAPPAYPAQLTVEPNRAPAGSLLRVGLPAGAVDFSRVTLSVGPSIVDPLWSSGSTAVVMMPLGTTGGESLTAVGPGLPGGLSTRVQRSGSFPVALVSNALFTWTLRAVLAADRLLERHAATGGLGAAAARTRLARSRSTLVAFAAEYEPGAIERDPDADPLFEQHRPADPCWTVLDAASGGTRDERPAGKREVIQEGRALRALIGNMAIRSEGFARMAARSDVTSAVKAEISGYVLRDALLTVSAALPLQAAGAIPIDDEGAPLRSLATGQSVTASALVWFTAPSPTTAIEFDRHWDRVFAGEVLNSHMAPAKRRLSDWLANLAPQSPTESTSPRQATALTNPDFLSLTEVLGSLRTELPLDVESAKACLTSWAAPWLMGSALIASSAGQVNPAIEFDTTEQGTAIVGVRPGRARVAISLAGTATLLPIAPIGGSVPDTPAPDTSWQTELLVVGGSP